MVCLFVQMAGRHPSPVKMTSPMISAKMPPQSPSYAPSESSTTFICFGGGGGYELYIDLKFTASFFLEEWGLESSANMNCSRSKLQSKFVREVLI